VIKTTKNKYVVRTKLTSVK